MTDKWSLSGTLPYHFLSARSQGMKSPTAHVFAFLDVYYVKAKTLAGTANGRTVPLTEHQLPQPVRPIARTPERVVWMVSRIDRNL